MHILPINKQSIKIKREIRIRVLKQVKITNVVKEREKNQRGLVTIAVVSPERDKTKGNAKVAGPLVIRKNPVVATVVKVVAIVSLNRHTDPSHESQVQTEHQVRDQVTDLPVKREKAKVEKEKLQMDVNYLLIKTMSASDGYKVNVDEILAKSFILLRA